MPITFYIPTHLCAFTGGQNPVTLAASPGTLRDALESLWSLHPGLRDRIVDEQGEVRQHINVFVGDECTRFMGGLATSVPDGAEISIIPAVSGGLRVARLGRLERPTSGSGERQFSMVSTG